MKMGDVIPGVVLLASLALLLALSPDKLTMIIIGIMGVLMIFGYLASVILQPQSKQ